MCIDLLPYKVRVSLTIRTVIVGGPDSPEVGSTFDVARSRENFFVCTVHVCIIYTSLCVSSIQPEATAAVINR